MFKLDTSKNQSKVPKVWIILSFIFLLFLSYSTYDFVLIDEDEAKIINSFRNSSENPPETNIFGQPVGEDGKITDEQLDDNEILAIGYASGVFTIGLIMISFISFRLRPRDIPEEDTVYEED